MTNSPVEIFDSIALHREQCLRRLQQRYGIDRDRAEDLFQQVFLAAKSKPEVTEGRCVNEVVDWMIKHAHWELTKERQTISATESLTEAQTITKGLNREEKGVSPSL